MIKDYLKKLNFPQKNSHKGQNGKLLIIGGSKLFHAASLWSLKVASRIADLVHYSSVEENNVIVQKLKEEFRDGIVVPRKDLEFYIEEDDCILIGPGMTRDSETEELTNTLLKKFPKKRWVIDAGALQMLELDWIPPGAILTPHRREFDGLFSKITNPKMDIKEQVKWFAKEFSCTILLKGEIDIIVSNDRSEVIEGGNAGMTKGGTGDVLAGLTAALYCVNDSFTSAVAASYINKKAGDALFDKMGFWFNASDLADQIPITMKKLLLDK